MVGQELHVLRVKVVVVILKGYLRRSLLIWFTEGRPRILVEP